MTVVAGVPEVVMELTSREGCVLGEGFLNYEESMAMRKEATTDIILGQVTTDF